MVSDSPIVESTSASNSVIKASLGILEILDASGKQNTYRNQNDSLNCFIHINTPFTFLQLLSKKIYI